MAADRWTRWGKVVLRAVWGVARLILFWVVTTPVATAVLVGTTSTAVLVDEWWTPYWAVAIAGVGAVVIPQLVYWFLREGRPWRDPRARWQAAIYWLLASLGAASIALVARGWRVALLHFALALLAPTVLGTVALRRRARGLDAPADGGRTGDGLLPVLNAAYERGKPPEVGHPEVEVHDDAILVARYPYVHSSVYPGDVTLPPSRITSTYGAAWSPAVVVDGREVIFLPSDQEDALRAFAERHGIPSSVGVDVWKHLAEPYLDQPYEPEQEARDYEVLASHGFPREEVLALREEIAGTMLACTFLTMEWVAYRIEDIVRGYAVLRPAEFTRERYDHIMRVAVRPYGAGAVGANG